MEIFETFGLEWQLVVAQIINFIIIYFILKKYLYKPLLRMIAQRQDLAKESVEKSQESEKVLEKAEAQEKIIIQKAQTSSKQIITDAKETAEEIVKSAEIQAKKQSEATIAEAKIQIQQETEIAQAKLNEYVSTLSIQLLKKSLSNVFTEKEQQEIIQRAVKELQKRPN